MEIVPMAFLCYAAAIGQSTLESSAYMTLFLNWAHVLNALCVILIVRPYRLAVLKALIPKAQMSGASVEPAIVHTSPGTHPMRNANLPPVM